MSGCLFKTNRQKGLSPAFSLVRECDKGPKGGGVLGSGPAPTHIPSLNQTCTETPDREGPSPAPAVMPWDTAPITRVTTLLPSAPSEKWKGASLPQMEAPPGPCPHSSVTRARTTGWPYWSAFWYLQTRKPHERRPRERAGAPGT